MASDNKCNLYLKKKCLCIRTTFSNYWKDKHCILLLANRISTSL